MNDNSHAVSGSMGAESRGSSSTSNGLSNEATSLLYDLGREALIEKRRSRRWKIFFRFLFSALILAAILAPLIAGLKPGEITKHTAIVEVKGVIAENTEASASNIIEALNTAIDNKNTAGIILRVNSPGGSPVQSGIVFDEIKRLRSKYPDKPIHAVVSDVCASGGYYIASAAENIYADKASIVGSIGVVIGSFGFTEAMEKLGVERRVMTAGENKVMMDPFQPENAEHKAHFQTLLDNIHSQFIDVVKEGRGDRLTDNNQLFSGLFWTGEQSLELGLIDGLSSERTVARDIIGAEKLKVFSRDKDMVEQFMEKFVSKVSIELLNHFYTLNPTQ